VSIHQRLDDLENRVRPDEPGIRRKSLVARLLGKPLAFDAALRLTRRVMVLDRDGADWRDDAEAVAHAEELTRLLNQPAGPAKDRP
jgi:hypothetical protein